MRRGFLVFLLVVLTVQPSNLYELTGRLNRFAEHYNLFVEELNAGAFDVAEAKQLSKIWHQIERSGMWPREKK